MSVINKMLRDLDHRQATIPSGTIPSGSATGTMAAATAALRQGTTSVGIDILSDIGSPKDRSRLWLGLASVATVVAAVGGWLWWSANTTSAPVAAPTQTINPAPTSAPIAASALTASVPPSARSSASASNPEPASDPAVIIAPAASINLRMESSLTARRALDALLSTQAPVASAPPVPADRPKARPTAANTAQPSATVNDNNGAPAIQRQQQAGGDAIAQAQSLWNSGSHDAAMDLIQQSIAATERSLKAGTAAGSSTVVLVPLVREMARMQLAEGRFGMVWEMLTRLEPLLGNQADLWAIRANAAQRLGRHPDSVHAYMMALQTRPDEQRWLLGTAVSLAALGQTTSAAEMAEKARAVGPVSKDILAYLRQTGVPLRDP